MENLSNSVLLDIFERLQLPTHLELYGMHPKYDIVIDHIWSRKYVEVNLNFESERFSLIQLNLFFGSISPYVKSIEIHALQRNEFNVFLSHIYPQARILRYTFKKDVDYSSTDKDMPSIVSSFPSIKRFFPQGRISDHISQMKYLTHLNLHQCSEIEPQNVPTIVNTLKLVWLRLQCTPHAIRLEAVDRNTIKDYGGLQQLFLNSHELLYFMRDRTATMSSLRELAISYPLANNRLYAFRILLVKRRYHEIVEMQTKSIFNIWCFLHELINARPLKMRKAMIICDPSAFSLDPAPARYIQLREVAFIKCPINCITLVNVFLARAKTVELIRIEYCPMHVYNFPIDVEEIVDERRTRLTLNFFQNNCNNIETEAIILGESDLFELTANEPAPIKDNFELRVMFDQNIENDENQL